MNRYPDNYRDLSECFPQIFGNYSRGQLDRRLITDGIYGLESDIQIFVVKPPRRRMSNPNREEGDPYLIDNPNYEKELERFETDLQLFLNANPAFAIANAYETHTILLLSRCPVVRLSCEGTGFNYGATSVIESFPGRVLVIAAND